MTCVCDVYTRSLSQAGRSIYQWWHMVAHMVREASTERIRTLTLACFLYHICNKTRHTEHVFLALECGGGGS